MGRHNTHRPEPVEGQHASRITSVRFSIGARLMVLFTAAILIAAVTVGLVSLRSAEDALEERILHGLNAVATAREHEITSLVEQDFERVALIASRTRLRECLVGIEEGDPESDELAVKMNQILDDALRSVEALQEVSATDAEGKIVASTNRDLIGKDADSQLFGGGKEGFYLGGLDPQEGGLVYYVAAPMVHPEAGTFIGVVIVRIELLRLAEILSDHTGLGETGELVLGERKGDSVELVGPLRHEAKDSARRSIALDSGTFEPLLLAMAQEEGITVAQDYRGVEVLAAYRHVAIDDWGLVAKIDTQEAFQPIAALRRRVALLGSLLAALGVVFAYLASKAISRRIQELQAGVERIASGQLDYRIEVKGQDELGELGAAFNQMASRLEEDITERQRAEEEIKQRSRELATLLEVSQALTATLDLNTVLQTSINGAVDLMELGSGAIYLLEGETLYLGATTPPLPPQFPEEFRRAPLADHPHIRQAIATGRPVILPDTATANLIPAERAVSELRGLRSIVYAPLLAAERAVGVLILASVGESRAFSEAEIDLSRTLSTQVALAVENARLYTSVQHHAAELEHRVAERTTELSERLAEIEQLNRALTNLLEDLRQANRLTAETARRLEEVNTELEAFTYSVSHDMRAPLRAMEGLSQALLEDYADRLDPVGQDYAQRIVGAAQRMDILIQDLLAYSRLTRAEMKLQPVGLEGVIQAALSLLTTEIQGKSAQVAVERPLPRVVGHQATLVRVVGNVLSNAVKFVAPDVQPQVRVWAETIATTRPPDHPTTLVRLWVEDNGIGIAPEYHERIFRIFERLHGVEAYPGTGVGLAIVRKGVERMGGRVGVESEPGQGSRFWVELAQYDNE